MGLDMYLTARQMAFNGFRNQELYNKLVQEAPFALDTAVLEVQVAYWRKANQIHKWFVDNVQDGVDDCHRHAVSREELQELLDTCIKVKENRKAAADLLPTTEGFFFGSTEYDEHYFYDVDQTLHWAARMLEDIKKGVPGDIYYQSNW
jgi:hypothetical protein